MPRRLTWPEYALEIAATAARRSEDPHRQVGACALNHQNMVAGVGYNGLSSGIDPPPEFWEDRDQRRKFMIHAETNCLSLCERGGVKLLAVTLLPCSSCATMIASYGVQEVFYSRLYERDEKALEIFDFYKIKVNKI